MKKLSMRGQVTIFIIVGIFLLAIVGLVLYVSQDSASREVVRTDAVPESFSPIQNFVHSCMQSVGRDAIEILGERGGYLFNENYPLQDHLNIRAFSDQPTEGNAFYFLPNIIIPYWFHVDSPNTARVLTTASAKPPLVSSYDEGIRRMQNGEKNIEAQIDGYVNIRLNNCLNNFRAFTNEGVQITTSSSPITTTIITENDVIINVEYPVQVVLDGQTEELRQFGVRIPVRLKDAYELAETITQAQAQFNFLEQNLNNLITYYSGVNEPLPPKSSVTFEVGARGKSWTANEVKETLELALSSNTQLLQVEGAVNYPLIFVETNDEALQTRQNIYDDMVLPIASTFDVLEPNLNIQSIDQLNLDSSEVSFQYLGWPIYAKPNVNLDNVGINFPPIQLGIQKYETYYDISWPVSVQVLDLDAFNGDGFVFRFGLEGNIRDNQPVNSEFTQRTRDSFPQICEDVGRNITITVKDTQCNPDCNPIQDAGIILELSTSGGVEAESQFISCGLGKTNNQGILEATIPEGIANAVIRVSHPDHIFSYSYLPQDASGINFYLPSLHNVSITVKKKIAQQRNGFWEVLPQEYDLSPEEEAIISLVRTSDNEQEFQDEFGVLFIYPNEVNQQMPSGIYQVQGLLYGEPDPAFAAQTLEYAQEAQSQGYDVDTSSIIGSFEEAPLRNLAGGVIFDENNPLRIPAGSITSGSEIIFYVVEFPNNSDPADIAELTRQYAQELAPLIR